ncbi:MAG: pyrroline-5-carboxylate reductase [Pirellulales bacterium]|nr:pyrroline-5-carboxylate reductase [Pirellulales bacterium]
MLPHRIALIGAGKMATALAEGLVRSGRVDPKTLVAADPDENAREHFTQATGGTAVADNAVAAVQADVLILAVKPPQMADVCTALRGHVPQETLIVSLAAGVILAQLQQWLGPEARLVRTMPNLPCRVAQGACGYALGASATPADAATFEELLGTVGVVVRVEEPLLDAVTGLSGSGPAFVYEVIEALSEGGVGAGLPPAVAAALAVQTVRGAAEMVHVTGESPVALRDRVASPGGTTVAGLQALEAGNLRAALRAAVHAATRRSRELGQGRM